MILRKYGTTVHSVVPNFDARAMNEIGFQKDGAFSLAWDEFQQKYSRVKGHELSAQAEGGVQQVAEEKVLNDLKAQLQQIESALAGGSVLLIESEAGKDYPKTREKQRTLVVGGENRLHFERVVEPPLRVGVYAEQVS
ncbi:MAG TPA: hypothetical protein VK864_05735 [Longimicrobiales bacterium]|nr:hypothetical protein [Longimicrobiales bacterium]